jgi:hypothetical protein
MIVIIIIVHINEKDLNFYVDFYYIFCYKCTFKYVDCLFENYDNQIVIYFINKNTYCGEMYIDMF